MTIRIICPHCHGEGMIEHRMFAAGFSPEDHTDPCGCCQGNTDLDGVCRVFDAHWERWRQHPRLAPCRRLKAIA